MADIDLDINNYSIKDIEKFFNLDAKKKYSAADIELKEYEIRERLLTSGHVNKRFKRDLIEFTTAAKEWLLFTKFGEKDTEPSIFKNQTNKPNPNRLDSIDLPISKNPLSNRENELIVREPTQYVHSNPSDFFPGNLNPLNTRIISKCMTIDTRFRENLATTTSSDFTIQLPTRLNKVVSMQLTSMELPIAFYSISSSYGNNFLYIYANTQYYQGGPIDEFEMIIIIPDGIYTSATLINTINKLLSPTNEDGSIKEPNSVFSYIHLIIDIGDGNSDTGKVIIKPFGEKENIVNSISLDFTKDINGMPDSVDITTKIGWNLGFIKKKYVGCNTIISESTINTKTIRYIYLAIDDFQKSVNNLFLNAFNNTYINDDVLARISLKSDSFTILMENNLNLITEPRRYFGPVDLQRLRIRIFDDHGRILNMQNSNYSFVLTFKMLYDL
jgi:hypothetical protein